MTSSRRRSARRSCRHPGAPPAPQPFAGFAAKNTTAIKILVGVVAALSAGILVANAAMKVYAAGQIIVKAATAAWTAAQWLLNAALAANPIGLVIVAVAALGAALVLAYTKSETFRNIVKAGAPGRPRRRSSSRGRLPVAPLRGVLAPSPGSPNELDEARAALRADRRSRSRSSRRTSTSSRARRRRRSPRSRPRSRRRRRDRERHRRRRAAHRRARPHPRPEHPHPGTSPAAPFLAVAPRARRLPLAGAGRRRRRHDQRLRRRSTRREPRATIHRVLRGHDAPARGGR